VAFSPDGQRLAVGDSDGGVWVWDDVDVDKSRALHRGPGLVDGVAFSPDGKHLAAADWEDGVVRVWEVPNDDAPPRILQPRRGLNFTCVAFSAHGARLAAGGSSGTVWVWNVTHLDQAPQLLRAGELTSVIGVAFSPDGQRLAAASLNGTVRVWASPSGRMLLDLRAPGAYWGRIAFSPDGKWLATAWERGVVLWDGTPLPPDQ
jgi:WD40 repeat protein